MENIEYENKTLCAKCGGRCCKKSGCDYFVKDFESMDTKYLENFLNQGFASIVATLQFRQLNTGKIIVTPILSIRARNINRGIIDLVSMKTPCMSLKENGCSFDVKNRPSGGVNYIPKENRQCESIINQTEELNKYIPYQKSLQRLAKKFTSVNFEAKLREDIENLIFDLLSDNIDNVSKEELKEIEEFLPLLVLAYPEEAQKAEKRYKQNQLSLVKKLGSK